MGVAGGMPPPTGMNRSTDHHASCGRRGCRCGGVDCFAVTLRATNSPILSLLLAQVHWRTRYPCFMSDPGWDLQSVSVILPSGLRTRGRFVLRPAARTGPAAIAAFQRRQARGSHQMLVVKAGDADQFILDQRYLLVLRLLLGP